MTMYVCRNCGKFYNSERLQDCPFCGESYEAREDLTDLIRRVAREVAEEVYDDQRELESNDKEGRGDPD